MFRRPRRAVAIGALMLLSLTASPGIGPAAAQTPTRAALTATRGDRVAEPEKWWGVAGAMLCGWGIRFIRVAPEIGMNPYVLAATIGGCLLAAMDQL